MDSKCRAALQLGAVQLRVKIQYPNLNFSRFRVKLHPTTSSSNHYNIMPRTPLGPISGNRRRGPDLSPFIRGGIIAAYRYSGGPTQITANKKLPINTVKKVLQNLNSTLTGVSKRRTGQPSIVDEHDKRYIIHTVRIQPHLTYKALKEATGHNFSKSTAYRILREYGLTNQLAKQRPLLTEEVAVKRLIWCRERRHWGWEEQSKVIQLDEYSVEQGTSKERAQVFRLPHKKQTKAMIQLKKKGKDVSVIVWGAFYRVGEQSNLIRLARDPNSPRQGYSAVSYIEVLDDQLPTLQEPGLLFMQDNASIHTSRLARQWFQNNSIDVLEWPPYSPDLNPIEHLQYRLKKNVYKVRPDIKEVGGDKEHIQEVLYDALEQAWVRIEGSLIEDLVRSIEKRVKTVITVDGWYTKY